MKPEKQPEFDWDIRTYWLCEGRDHQSGVILLADLRYNPLHEITESEFKWHLADAILNKRYSIEEYERLTELDFQTREEVAADLSELWHLLFKDEPIAMPVLSA